MTHPFITPFTLLPWCQTLANQHWAATGNYILFSWEICFLLPYFTIISMYICNNHPLHETTTLFWWLCDSETSVLSLLDDWYCHIFWSLVRKCVATYVKHLLYLLSQNYFYRVIFKHSTDLLMNLLTTFTQISATLHVTVKSLLSGLHAVLHTSFSMSARPLPTLQWKNIKH